MEVTNSEDTLDVRDIIERYEELQKVIDANSKEQSDERADAVQESETLSALLNELRGNGGDHEWRGAWYPVTLIRDSYFRDYAQELAEDIRAINRDAQWPLGCIDWEQAANELKIGYGTVKLNGITYWYRY